MVELDDAALAEVDAILRAWARDQKNNYAEFLRLWFPSQAGYLPHTFASGFRSSDEMQQEVDAWKLDRMDGCIASLDPLQRTAIFICYKLTLPEAVPPIPDYEYVLLSARYRLAVLLTHRDVVLA